MHTWSIPGPKPQRRMGLLAVFRCSPIVRGHRVNLISLQMKGPWFVQGAGLALGWDPMLAWDACALRSWPKPQACSADLGIPHGRLIARCEVTGVPCDTPKPNRGPVSVYEYGVTRHGPIPCPRLPVSMYTRTRTKYHQCPTNGRETVGIG